jgi:hypothetical protein
MDFGNLAGKTNNDLARTARVLLVLILPVLALPLTVPCALAQTSDARIAGTVYDSSRAAIPGATVTVKNERTAAERTATSNEQGYFIVPGLPPSTYTVTVSARALSRPLRRASDWRWGRSTRWTLR